MKARENQTWFDWALW